MITTSFEGKEVLFSNSALPKIGEKVFVTMNGLGWGIVRRYRLFKDSPYLGCMVEFDNPPEWYVQQNGGNILGTVFGAEMKLVCQVCLGTLDENGECAFESDHSMSTRIEVEKRNARVISRKEISELAATLHGRITGEMQKGEDKSLTFTTLDIMRTNLRNFLERIANEDAQDQ